MNRSPDECVRLAPTTWLRLGRNQDLTCARLTGEAAVLSEWEASWLRHCRRCEPIRQHAVQRAMESVLALRRSKGLVAAGLAVVRGALQGLVSRRIPGESISVAIVERRLREWRETGFLVTPKDVLRRVEQHRTDRERNHVPPLAGTVIAGGSARRVREWARHYAADQCERGHTRKLIVIGDVKGGWTLGREPEASQEVVPQSRRRIARLDRDGEERLARKLARDAGIDERILTGALTGGGGGESVGADLNAAILAMAGVPFLFVDGGRVADLSSACTMASSVRCTVSSRHDPREHRRFADVAAALHSLSAGTVDLTRLHEAHLGRSLAELLGSSGDVRATDIDEADDSAIEDLWLGRGRIVVTASGVVDLSAGTEGAGSERRAASSGHECWPPTRDDPACGHQGGVAFVRHLTVSNGATLDTVCFGLDNRSLLPPTIPQLGLDLDLYWTVLRRCVEDAYCAHLPLILGRVGGVPASPPIGSSRYPSELLVRVAVEWLTRGNLALAGCDPGRRMRALGRSLLELGQLGVEEFAHDLRAGLLECAADGLWCLEETETAEPLRSEAGQAFDRERHRTAVRKELAALCETEQQPDIESCSRTQRLVSDYGALLRVWPDVVHAGNEARMEKGLDWLC